MEIKTYKYIKVLFTFNTIYQGNLTILSLFELVSPALNL